MSLPRIQINMPRISLSKKPTYLKIAEGLDFFKLFAKIEEKYKTCFLFESLGEQSTHSRYSIIGFDPAHIISAKENVLTFDKQKFEVKNPYFALREIVPNDVISKSYAGGLIGYLSYEALNFFESSVKVKIHKLFPQFLFGVYLDGLILDKVTGETFYFFYEENRIEEIIKLLKQKSRKNKFKAKFLKESLTKKEHGEIVEKVKQEIINGNTFQCEVGFKSEYKITGETLAVYEKLRKVNPSPFMYYLKFDDIKSASLSNSSRSAQRIIIGASPELLLSLKDGDMETYPLAGTTKRGKNDEEDQILARKLLNDPKEIAEHNMLVDLHRNDLGKVSKFGTVKVKSLMDIKKFSHVQHISSEITGVLKDDEDMFSAVASNFPMGTVTGAPKVETIKIIDKNEPAARGPYGGGVGHFGFNGDCTFALTLRSLFLSGDYAYTQTSSGIVYDSDADKEYEEIQRKLAAMKEVLL